MRLNDGDSVRVVREDVGVPAATQATFLGPASISVFAAVVMSQALCRVPDVQGSF